MSSDTPPLALGVILRSPVDACGEDFVGVIYKVIFLFLGDLQSVLQLFFYLLCIGLCGREGKGERMQL